MGKILEKISLLWEKIAFCHRSAEHDRGWTDFFIPRLSWGFLIRLAVLVGGSVIIFGFLLIPCVIHGSSMEPTYKRVGLTFCWRGQFAARKPKRGDVVVIKYMDRVFYLKRIVGLPGETISFEKGVLYVNGKPLKEPYLRFVSLWDLPPRKVQEDHYYVVGDNRSMPLEQHKFGQVPLRRIIGAPIW